MNRAFSVPDNWKAGEWVTIKLKKPFKISNPNKSLYVGFGARNKSGRTTPGVAQVEGSTDGSMLSLDGLTSFDEGRSFHDRDAWAHSKQGYLAMRVLVSNTASSASDENVQVFSKGKQPVPFPEIKGYRVKRDGGVIADNLQVREFTDEDGTDNSNYQIEVIYDESSFIVGNQEVEAIKTLPYVFPSRLATDATLNISDNSSVTKVLVYAMDGTLVYSEVTPAERVSLAELASGTYLVVLETTQGRVSQRVIR